MRVLILGNGAREHSLAWKLSQSPLCTSAEIYPGNAGSRLSFPSDLMLRLPETPKVDGLCLAISDEKYDLVVIGQETYLEQGLSDLLNQAGVSVFGPSRACSQLETSKSFAKELMRSARVPTADYDLVSSEDEARERAQIRLKKQGGVVLKVDGLAAGKGVVVCSSESELEAGLKFIFSNEAFEESRERLVLEERLIGRECSFFTLLGYGEDQHLGFAVDHKRRHEGDKGPNTGGMGAYCPVPWLPKVAQSLVASEIIQPLKKELARRGLRYTGFLYVGLMWTKSGPKVIEFNVRLGDPEAQVLAVADKRDWLPLILNKLNPQASSETIQSLSVNLQPSVGVVLCSEFYPDKNDEKAAAPSLPLSWFEEKTPQSVQIFAGGLSHLGPKQLTGSGRLLTYVASSPEFSEARKRVYSEISLKIPEAKNVSWRSDIGQSL